jgi:serine-type D-Ala-D-Ala carboxypeptidase (penicillin-binding protein 5/6)
MSGTSTAEQRPLAVTAASQRRRRPRAIVVVLRWTVLLVLIALVVTSVGVLFAPPPRVAATPADLPLPAASEATIAWPADAEGAGIAVVGIDASLATAGRTDAMPMASLTKLITVLTVLEAHPIAGADRGAEITLGRADINALGASIRESAPVVNVYEGLVVTQRDLIEWALVGSAGNATWSLANWAFGSIDAFLPAANDWAARNGLGDTVVVDPIGLETGSAATTADMTRLALLAVADPVVLDAMSLEQVAVPGGRMQSTNPVAGEASIDGGKTGTLRVWGRNLLVTAEREVAGEPRRVVAVIMGVVTQDSMDAQMPVLVESLWDDFATAVVLPAGSPVAEYRAPWGARVTATTEADIEADAWGPHGASALDAAVREIEVGAPRQEVGAVASVDGFGVESSSAVRTTGILDGPDAGWRFAHPQVVLGWYFD